MSRNSRFVVQQVLGSGNRNIPCAARKLFPGCNFIQPQTLTSIPSSPPSPIYRPFSNSVDVPSALDRRRLSSKTPYQRVYGNSGQWIFDKIRDESLSAVCCFYKMHRSNWPFESQINQSLVDRFPHVKAFHFIVEDDVGSCYDITYDVTMRALGISSMPLFHFYQNGTKVEELAGDYIIRLERILEKLYKPFSSSIGFPSDRDVRLQSSMPIDSLIRIKSFSASYRNDYDSTAERIRDVCLDAVCCFYANQSMHLALIVQSFVEKFPNVKIYHFLVSNVHKDDTYNASMGALNVSGMPLFHFFQNGKKVAALVGDSIVLLDKTIKNLYKLHPFSASYMNEYDSSAKKIRDVCLDAVCCFYANQSMHLALIVQSFVEKFPNVKIYHFLVSNVLKDDTYDASLRALNVPGMPLFQFFQNGKKVDERLGDSIMHLDKTIKNLYNTQELDTHANEVKDHKGAVEGRESKVSTLSQ